MSRLPLLCCLSLVACVTANGLPAPSSVPSTPLHQVKRVRVAEGVELEVLDFGGRGPALVFVPGMGCTGHVFDTFAPAFTATHHVYAVTRRGFGSSSWPEHGYDTPTLGEDLVRVLDGLALAKASFAGHSIAGPELTWTATHHPSRVEKVIYLDPSTGGDLFAELYQVLPWQPEPPRPAEDEASRTAYAAALARDVGGPLPEHEVEEAFEFDSQTGHYLRARERPDAEEQVARGVGRVDFAAVQAPVLFLTPAKGPPRRAESWPEFSTMTPRQQEKLRDTLSGWLQRQTETENLGGSHPHWKTVKLPHARHFIWITHPEDVRREMNRFLAALPAGGLR